MRNRLIYIIFIVIIICFGFFSRTFSSALPSFISAYSGDVLWALMVFLLVGILFPKKSTKTNIIIAILIAFSVEFSQLYHIQWLDGVRSTKFGRLILGNTFLWSDIICYTIGIAIGGFLEKIFLKK